MGWPRKCEAKLYYEARDKTYLLVYPETEHNGCYDGYGELMIHNDPERPVLCSCSPSLEYIRTKCRRASWLDMPKVWQDEYKRVIFDLEPKQDPMKVRGLLRMEELK